MRMDKTGNIYIESVNEIYCEKELYILIIFEDNLLAEFDGQCETCSKEPKSILKIYQCLHMTIRVAQSKEVSISLEGSHLILPFNVSLNIDVSNQNIVGGASDVFPDTLYIIQEVMMSSNLVWEVERHIKVL